MTKMTYNHVMLFTYDFPNKKTQDFIFRLLIEGYIIDYIIAAPWEDLKMPIHLERIKPRHSGILHPKIIAKHFGIPYKVYKHNSSETVNYLKKHPVSFYIIAGARILKGSVIEATKNKTINIHPGLIPETRGLDTLLWAICANNPIGITAHFINSKIDGGIVIYKERLKIYADDTLIDISLRQLEVQTEILIKALTLLNQKGTKLVEVDCTNFPSNTKMPIELEKITLGKFDSWKKTFQQ